MTLSSLTLECRAKVNLALSVGSPDPASGLHPLASWMALVHFADTLTLRRADAGERSTFAVTPTPAGEGQPPVQVDWSVEQDLAWRAHQLLEARVGRPLAVHARIEKRIPAGAGLAGGSADAAGMLLGLRRLFDLEIDYAALAELAGRLGSDVIFVLRAHLGPPAALVRGFGEIIEPLPPRVEMPLVLVFPPFGCPTGAVYRAFDRRLAAAGGRAVTPDVGRVRELAGATTLSPEGPFNDLAEAAFDVQPPLRTLRDRLQGELGLPVHVTGSGSTLFLVAPSLAAGTALARVAARLTGLPAVATRTA